jgi:hypothetical protein
MYVSQYTYLTSMERSKDVYIMTFSPDVFWWFHIPTVFVRDFVA